MKTLNRLYSWYGKRTVNVVLGILVVLIIGAIIKSAGGEEAAPISSTTATKSVSVVRAGDFSSASTFRVVGTVESVSEARLQTESSGRVTSVRVSLGDRVGAGTVIASLENSREQASLLQAEGAYDAAVVQNAQSSISLDTSAVSAQNTYRSALASAESAVVNLADELFSNPDAAVSGVRIDAQGRAVQLNNTRVEIKEALEEWRRNVNSGLRGMSPAKLLEEAEENTTEVSNYITTLAQLVAKEEPNSVFTEEVLASYKSRFEGARAALNGSLSGISAARQSYEQATLSASGGSTSLADAQLKSALGTLRAAQANYEKTLVRTPISGTVNALYLKVGDYANQGMPAALVANNGQLEIKTAVGEEDAALLAVSDIVSIDSRATGTISRIAPGVDPLTGKIEVRIALPASSDLTNGSTVSITFTKDMETEESDEIVVPIQALKMLPSGPVAFSVTEEGTLAAHPVTLGEVRGSMVVVQSGISADTDIIDDARGMQEGDKVEITQD